MSDEFMKLATKEINEEIDGLISLLSSCNNDSMVISNAEKFQKHTHKIKGLAPMMGKEELGNIASTLDDVFKKLVDGSTVDGFYKIISDAFPQMLKSMTEPEFDLSEIKNRISQILDNLN